MWIKSHTTKVRGLTAAKVWKVWSNVNQWSTWQRDLDYAKLEGEFKTGNTFLLKPKGGPRVRIHLLEAVPNRGFIDLTRFPMARMYGSHQFEERDGELELTTTISMEGPLAFLWRKIVGEGVVESLAGQTASLIQQAASV